jgi:glycosyltransferase involved in cell wall biosynthesis
MKGFLKMKYRVLLDVTPLFSPNPRGIGTYIIELTKSFKELGGEIEILLGYKFSRIKYWRRRSRIPLNFRSGPFMDRPFFFYPASFHLFHGTDRFLPEGDIPKVLTVHDLLPLYEDFDFLDMGTRELMRKKIFTAFERDPEIIIAVSDFVRNEIERFFPELKERVTVIPHGVSREFRRCGIGEVKRVLEIFGIETPYLLFVGEPEKRKNLHNVIGAFRLVMKKFQNLKLVLVGAPLDFFPDELIRIMEPVKERVVIVPFVNVEILKALYSGAEVFLFPTLYEGFGLPVLEAMACGTPVLISNHPALLWVAGDAALSVEGDSGSIKEGIERIMEDENLRNLLVERGFERVKDFDWRKTALKTLEIYRKILSHGMEE